MEFNDVGNIAQITFYMYTMYCHSTGDATALLYHYAVSLSETMQQSWRSLRFLSTCCCALCWLLV